MLSRYLPNTRRIPARLLRFSALLLACCAAPCTAQPAGQLPPDMRAMAVRNRAVVAGETWFVNENTTLDSLRIEAGGAVVAPPGRSLTMTVDGVETTLKPGRYKGSLLLTVTEEHPVPFSPVLTHRFRQALMLDARGVVVAKSVPVAAGSYKVNGSVLTGARIRSRGDNFNGLLVVGGDWQANDLDVELEGPGGNDFAGHGAAVMSDGTGTRLVLDRARIRTRGVVRTALVCHNGSRMVVKNSDVMAESGALPPDYVSNVTPGEMRDAPWMLGISGNARATNVLGDNTQCTYIGSRVVAEGWGVLSVDNSRDIRLTAINSHIEVTGRSGYGSYAIGNSTNAFYGSTIQAPTMGLIVTGGRAIFASSSAERVAALNGELNLGLSTAEIGALQVQQTRVASPRNGVMLWGDGGTVTVEDGTIFDTGEAVFLNKGSTARFEVDGSSGAQLNSRSGVLLQAMDNDDPGPQMKDGLLANTGVWRDPTAPAEKVPGYDLAAEHDADTHARFTKIVLTGDIFNATRQRTIRPPFDPHRPPMEPPRAIGANLVIELSDAQLTGLVTAATARHLKDPIGAADYEAIGRVVNTPAAAINNGVLLKLQRSRWTVTGPSHLTRLTLDASSAVVGLDGRPAILSVDGAAKPWRVGSYSGRILVQPAAP